MHGDLTQQTDMRQGFGHMALFVFKLFGVVQKLPFTSTAIGFVWAGRRHTVARWFQQFGYPGLGIAFLFTMDPYERPIAGDRLVDKNGHAVQPHQPPAAEGDVGDGHFVSFSFFYNH